MCFALAVRVILLLTVLSAAGADTWLTAADRREYPFEVRETAGIRRRNDVITIRSLLPHVVEHAAGFRVLQDGKPVPAQFRRVALPGEPPQLVVDFIDHFTPFAARRYVLQLIDEPSTGEPADGLMLTETGDAYHIDSSGLVFWTIRKDLAGLLDFSWKQTDYIAADSAGLFFKGTDGARQLLADRPPSRVAIERQGPLATSLVFDYDDWPQGAHSRLRLEFVRTRSWIRGSWTIDGGAESVSSIGAELNLQLDGPEALLDFGAGDFVYATVTEQQAARLEAGPRAGASVPWRILHGPAEALEPIVVAPRHVPTPEVPGWAHVMDDKRCTALAVGGFGESAQDAIAANGRGRLTWSRTFNDAAGSTMQARHLEFWLHFVTMPVHIGARTSPRWMQEPLEVKWLAE